MSPRQIEIKQNKIAKTLKFLVHPDNTLAHAMTARYRELENMKKSLL